MSDVKVIPGKPIRAGALHTAIAALGLDPTKVKAFELHGKGVEASWGDGTYSSHTVADDPWMPDDESSRFLVIDLERLDKQRRENMRQLVRWYIEQHGTPPEAPF